MGFLESTAWGKLWLMQPSIYYHTCACIFLLLAILVSSTTHVIPYLLPSTHRRWLHSLRVKVRHHQIEEKFPTLPTSLPHQPKPSRLSDNIIPAEIIAIRIYPNIAQLISRKRNQPLSFENRILSSTSLKYATKQCFLVRGVFSSLIKRTFQSQSCQV